MAAQVGRSGFHGVSHVPSKRLGPGVRKMFETLHARIQQPNFACWSNWVLGKYNFNMVNHKTATPIRCICGI